MEWSDEGMLLSVRKHGEGSAIIEVFTENHGRHGGVVRGGGSRKAVATLQPSAQLTVTWRARLEDHLGSFTVEPKYSRVASIMAGRAEIAAFSSIAALISTCLPERENQGSIYLMTMALMDDFSINQVWMAKYIHWEMALLNELGFGLDLNSCAATGANDGLCFVSPKSGRAVSRSGAVGWEDKLLKLPDFLINESKYVPSNIDILDGLQLTGYFLNNGIMAALGRKELPQARARFTKVLEAKLS